jgi:hypothetical protein
LDSVARARKQLSPQKNNLRVMQTIFRKKLRAQILVNPMAAFFSSRIFCNIDGEGRATLSGQIFSPAEPDVFQIDSTGHSRGHRE